MKITRTSAAVAVLTASALVSSAAACGGSRSSAHLPVSIEETPPFIVGARDRRLTIDDDGRARLRLSASSTAKACVRRFRVAPAKVDAVRSALAAARFRSLQPVYKGQISDTENTIITHDRRVVKLIFGAAGPPRLRPLVRILDTILSAHSC